MTKRVLSILLVAPLISPMCVAKLRQARQAEKELGCSDSHLLGLHQSDHRVVNERADPKEPIQNLGIKVAGKHVKLSEEFDNGDDWLKGVALEIKNRSNKTIVYIETDFAFFETQATGSVMLFALRNGRRPWRPEDASKPELRLETGAVTDLPISDQTYDSMKKFLAQGPAIRNLHTATLRREIVVFDDGMAWSGGSFRCPDQNRPGDYYPVNSMKCP